MKKGDKYYKSENGQIAELTFVCKHSTFDDFYIFIDQHLLAVSIPANAMSNLHTDKKIAIIQCMAYHNECIDLCKRQLNILERE